MILIDQPHWPAHGVSWAHVVSDESLAELHTFAQRVGLPTRSFDLDHYDVPQTRHAELIAAGAVLVPRRELIRRLARSGLRVPGRARPAAKRQMLEARWDALLPGHSPIGAELLNRWHEPHRVYHSPVHLRHTLDSLTLLLQIQRGQVAEASAPPATEADVVVEALALWFHDAVHTGGSSASASDEEDSAQLAIDLLGPVAGRHNLLSTQDVDEVARLVLVTKEHDPAPDDHAGARVSDADLAILGSAPDRYARYVTQVRTEYTHVPDGVFRPARGRILDALVRKGPIFRTPAGSERWEAQAQHNLRTELASLR